MKQATTVLADAPTTTLKLAYSYLVERSDSLPKEAPAKAISTPKVSPYKSLFVVNPVVHTPAVWDVEWYNNYE